MEKESKGFGRIDRSRKSGGECREDSRGARGGVERNRKASHPRCPSWITEEEALESGATTVAIHTFNNVCMRLIGRLPEGRRLKGSPINPRCKNWLLV